MAHMYPDSLREDDVESRAELKLFDAFRRQLDDDWDVFHSTNWTQRRGERGSWDGEIDFVVSHPERGFLCIEAKGGGAKFDNGQWYRKLRGSWLPYSKDPFEQAVGHTHALRQTVSEMPGWRERHPLIGHAVSFPEVQVNARRLPPAAPRQILIDRDDVAEILGALERAFAFHGGEGREAPGDRGMRMLRERLTPTIEVELPLAEKFLEEEEQLTKLTREQTLLLRRFGRNRRMAVSGCAGSGKTMLAVEQAKWLKREKGLDVVFVCFNRQLAEHLRVRERGSGVEFTHFHSLCVRLAQEAPGVRLPTFSDDDDPEAQDFWVNRMPELLVDAMTELGGRYGALMVDEAQDLHNHWLTALMTTLRDEEDAYVWLFMDSNQRVYEALLDVPREFVHYDLAVNCRNTQAIHREVMKKYRGEVVPETLGPEGSPVELIQTDDQPSAVAGVIERLCGREQVPPQDVVVLSSHGFEKSDVPGSLPGRYRLVDKRNQSGNRVFFSSIRGFKGLESKVVILCELEDIEESLDAQLYVGISRAINYCVVVVPKP
jgi:hypothetical protein